MVCLSAHAYEKCGKTIITMDRREFFNLAIQKSKSAFAEQFAERAPRIGLRPPGAISEEAFLLSCTRCGECEKACPYQAIYSVDMEQGKAYGKTPFIDVNLTACEYCEDFPCIQSCEPGALVKEQQYIKMGLAVVHKEHCLVYQGQYCDYCAKSCPSAFDALSMGEDNMPIIDKEKCVGCGQCAYICPAQSGAALFVKPLQA